MEPFVDQLTRLTATSPTRAAASAGSSRPGLGTGSDRDGHERRGAIGFAEKVLELLEEGRCTATYKYAVLLALIDVCLERTQHSGAPPDMVTTRQLADKIVEIYWPYTLPFAGRPAPVVLRQNTTGQAEIVSAITRFRERHAPDPTAPRWHARMANPKAYVALVSRVEWKLIEMPLTACRDFNARSS